MASIGEAAVDDRAAPLRGLLGELGYSDELLAANFPVWTNGSVETADIVGFGATVPHDMTTATIVGGLAYGLDVLAPRQLDLARVLATPVGIIAGPEYMQIWTVSGPAGDARVLADVGYDGLDATQGRLRSELAPNALLAAKRAGRQLSLFPIDVGLLSRARRDVAARLSQRVEEAMAFSRERRSGVPQPAADARLVLAAAGALMVRDKLAGSDPSPQGALRFALETYPDYFGWLGSGLGRNEASLVESVIALLSEGVNYASVDPAIVSEVYENALVDADTRTRLGIHYTPFELARTLVRHVPFEELAPEKRTVLDPACGSGTLLLAAQDRLGEAAPSSLLPKERHSYIRSHMRGFDTDPFAREIARLALLLNGLPEGDSWQIDVRDALAQTSEDGALQPTVVISNPPWKGTRSKAGRRDELADHFLERMLELVAPGGFLAVILPATWLASATSRDSRDHLARHAAIFELWRLPADTFGSSSMAPCVLFARKDESPQHFVFRRILSRPGWQDRFLVEEEPDETYLTVSGDGLDGTTLLRGPLDAFASTLAGLPKLDSIAEVLTGPVPLPGRTPDGSGIFPYLRLAKKIPPFAPVRQQDTEAVNYPDDFHRSSTDPAQYLRPKLLVSAKRTADNPWRLVVRHDPIGVIFRETLSGVIPRSEETRDLCALATILSSALASCWIDALDSKMSYGVRLLRELPVPSPDADWAGLADIGSRLLRAGTDQHFDPLLFEQIESATLAAYGLPTTASDALAAHFAGIPAPEGRARFHPLGTRKLSEEPIRRRYGSVLEVTQGRLRIWVQGITDSEGVWLEIPKRMPGWLCRLGATFDVEVSGEDLAHARYSFQSRSYLDMAELVPWEAIT